MSTIGSKSYRTVQYDLRPSKQVVRRIFLDFFQRLSSCGVNVDQFQYTGMGSIHFVDHILFHKFLGVRNLVSVEGDSSISRRVQFNCPYRNVAIELMSISDYIPKLNPSAQHIVWLDYDSRICREILDDVSDCAGLLSTGSFVFVTVDAEPGR